ncbi:MAG: hypothetical protein IPK77_05100 [Cellvibrio sp.]|nr:hypothetical protein [Cellvibrio sp.]
MKLRFENIFEAVFDDLAHANEVQVRANILSSIRDLIAHCQWDQLDKVSVSIDENNIMISRTGLEPKYPLEELLEQGIEKR